MYQIGRTEKFFDATLHKLAFSLVTISTILLSTQPISQEVQTRVKNPTFHIEFSDFSPAFAAFEDEFLFDDKEAVSSLKAGRSDQSFQALATEKPSVVVTAQPKKVNQSPSLLAMFDGEASIFKNNIPDQESKTTVADHNWKPTTLSGTVQNEELSQGSLMAMVRGPVEPGPKRNMGPQGPLKPGTPSTNSTVKQKDLDPAPTPKPEPRDKYQVRGTIQLRDGLAFVGSMEVSWVVDDYELKRGAIDTRDGTYDIETTDLVGQVIVSLYDLKDELIGEGILDLMDLTHDKGDVFSNIDVYPINWDEAGIIFDGMSIGSGVTKPVSGADVALYSFNEATTTTSKGSFEFPGWKKANSKTLAIASKSGFRDSIFMLDSKKAAKVMLLDNSYVDALFSYLSGIGIHSDKERGLIYGQLTGTSSLDGYKVHLEGHQAIFIENGLATTERKSTSSSGLFTFVGLSDGDYELYVEKDGEIIDRRILVVEQGKISPVLINLNQTQKFIEFFDPLDPKREIKSIDVSFFDGSTSIDLIENRGLARLPGGHDGALIDINTPTEITRTFASRDKTLQMIPLINNAIFKVISQEALQVEDGLIVGFVDSDETFQVYRIEGEAKKVLYFNEVGELVDPKVQPAFGFIMSGFHKGLSSLAIERVSDGLVMTSDLVFSDHQSISIINSKAF